MSHEKSFMAIVYFICASLAITTRNNILPHLHYRILNPHNLNTQKKKTEEEK